MYKAFDWARPVSLLALGTAMRRQREALDLTLDAVAALTGISKPYLSNIETGRTPGPASEEKLRKIGEALKLPVEEVLVGADWLRTPASIRRAVAAAEAGKGPGGEGVGELPRRADGAIDLDRLVPASPPTGVVGSAGERGEGEGLMPVRNVPLINKVAAGKAAEFGDLGYPAGVADAYVPAPDLPGAPAAAAFALRVTGDSMAPEYQEGEIVIVGPGTAKDGDDCVVRLGELEQFATTFKRVYFVQEGEEAVAVRLVALNRAYGERVVGVEAVTGIYPVMYRVLPARGGAGGGAGQGGGVPAEEVRGEEQSFTTRVSIEHD